jgi:hypothetical protein
MASMSALTIRAHLIFCASVEQRFFQIVPSVWAFWKWIQPSLVAASSTDSGVIGLHLRRGMRLEWLGAVVNSQPYRSGVALDQMGS